MYFFPKESTFKDSKFGTAPTVIFNVLHDVA
jgi:hypothetical protein